MIFSTVLIATFAALGASATPLAKRACPGAQPFVRLNAGHPDDGIGPQGIKCPAGNKSTATFTIIVSLRYHLSVLSGTYNLQSSQDNETCATSTLPFERIQVGAFDWKTWKTLVDEDTVSRPFTVACGDGTDDNWRFYATVTYVGHLTVGLLDCCLTILTGR